MKTASFSETVNKDSNRFLSKFIINENQIFVLDQLRKHNTATANTKQRGEIHTNDNKSLI